MSNTIGRYEIDISKDNDGYYFDIHKITPIGGNLWTKEYITDPFNQMENPYKTKDKAIEAAKKYLETINKETP